MDLKEIGWVGRDWIHLAQDRNPWRVLMNIYIYAFLTNYFCIYVNLYSLEKVVNVAYVYIRTTRYERIQNLMNMLMNPYAS
jgi:hypothetical protein